MIGKFEIWQGKSHRILSRYSSLQQISATLHLSRFVCSSDALPNRESKAHHHGIIRVEGALVRDPSMTSWL